MHRQGGCFSGRKDLFALRINYIPACWHAVSYYCLVSESIIIACIGVRALARVACLSTRSRQAIQADLARYSVAAISSLAFVGDISPTISIWHADECRQRNMIDHSASLMLVIPMERSPSSPSTLLRCYCWADKAAQILLYNPCTSGRECVLTSLHDALRAKKAPHHASMRVASYSCPCLFASQQQFVSECQATRAMAG